MRVKNLSRLGWFMVGVHFILAVFSFEYFYTEVNKIVQGEDIGMYIAQTFFAGLVVSMLLLVHPFDFLAFKRNMSQVVKLWSAVFDVFKNLPSKWTVRDVTFSLIEELAFVTLLSSLKAYTEFSIYAITFILSICFVVFHLKQVLREDNGYSKINRVVGFMFRRTCYTILYLHFGIIIVWIANFFNNMFARVTRGIEDYSEQNNSSPVTV